MNKLLLACLLILVAIALFGGFWVVGGPGHGRMERMDEKRMSDLREISRALSCDINNTALPETLEPDEPVDYCNRKIRGGKWKDPVTGLPYEYSLLGDNRFKVCAVFALSEVENRPWSGAVDLEFDGTRGCVIGAGAELKS